MCELNVFFVYFYTNNDCGFCGFPSLLSLQQLVSLFVFLVFPIIMTPFLACVLVFIIATTASQVCLPPHLAQC